MLYTYKIILLQKKRLSKPRPVEMGTQNKGDVDYDWLPKETLNEISEYTNLNKNMPQNIQTENDDKKLQG